jgi:two-component system NarL family response regulator
VEVAQHLRVTLPRTRILILTGYDSEQYARVFLRLGVAGYLTKTASTQELVCALRTAWAGQRYVQPAVAVALEQTVSGSTPTPRELATLRLVADGLRNEEIGARLYITERTVRFHLDHLFRKFEVASRVELVHVAHDQGWLTPWGSG